MPSALASCETREQQTETAAAMAVENALHGDSASAAEAAAVVDELFSAGVDLETFFDNVALEVAAAGGEGKEEEELEWLSNKDAFPAVETMLPAAPRPRAEGARRPPRVAAKKAAAAAVAGRRCRHCGTEETPQWREGPEGRATLCNACGLRYRSGRLVPEYRPASSPTFSRELHSNCHRRIVEMMAGRPRTESMRRPRKAVERLAIAWSPPPPPRAPAVAGRRPSQGEGAGVTVEQGHVPDGGADDGLVGCAAAVQVRAAIPADAGSNPTAPPAPSAAAGRRCQQCGAEKTPQWLEGPKGRSTLCDACVVRNRNSCVVPVPPVSSELRFDWHNRVKLHRRQQLSAKISAGTDGGGEEGARRQTKGVRLRLRKRKRKRKRVVELSPRRMPPPPLRRHGRAAVAVEQGGVFDGGAAAAADECLAAAPAGDGKEPATRDAAPWAPAVPGRQCRHCGTMKTPQWREGPEGRQTLCNACGVRYKSGLLVPEYRPASSPTFSPDLHSNRHRQVVQLRRRREESTEVCRLTSGDK